MDWCINIEFRRRKTQICLALILLLGFISPLVGFSADDEKLPTEGADRELGQAIWSYKHEDYEEAYDLLKKLRTERPESSLVAYYLGITCKQMQNFGEAKPHLEAAVMLKPRIKNALLELIDILYKQGELGDALKWIDVAEKESIYPVQTAFFKGLVLLKEGNDMDSAVKSLEEAKNLDDTVSEAADYYIGLAYVKAKKLDEAKKVFEKVVESGKSAGLAAFAEQYMSAIEKKMEATKPFHAALGAALQYDSNVVLKPYGVTLAEDIGDEGDWRQVYTADLEYNVRPSETIGARLGYSFYFAKQFERGFYDTMSHNVSADPALYFGDAAITFPFYYNHILVNEKSYLDAVSIGNIDNFKIGTNQMTQFAFSYRIEDYIWAPSGSEESRDSNEYTWHVAWFGFFAEGKGLANMKYTVNYDDTKGANWRYVGNKITISSVVPLMKGVKFASSADFFLQKFLDTNTIYGKRRIDSILTATSSLIFEIFKDTELQLNYVYVDDVSNIAVYKYQRSIYSMGMKYYF